MTKFQSFFIDNNHITWHKSNIYTENSIIEINMSIITIGTTFYNKHRYILIIMKLEFLTVTKIYYKN